MADDESSDISSDSDEEFLTVSDDRKGHLDREALVRKKLLENFYGKSAVAAAAPTTSMVDTYDEDEDEDADDDRKVSPAVETEDLDSPSFDAAAYTERLVRSASVHTLLEKEEQLALQVRTLDSTMQTLVYENYTRFIDATDAIRSIGVNVQANEEGLSRLTSGMESIDQKSKAIEDALGPLRDQVAEKIRVKRLLTRLDALLKLPKTLKEEIGAGKYRTATRSYLQAASILGKHSEGFESLRNIETECTMILSEMKKELNQKLLHWSGRLTTFESLSDESNDSDTVPDPPKNMAEIFECAGTLLILLQSGQSISEDDDSETSVDDLQSMTSSAALRLLDRALDSHLIEVQERRFAAPGLDSALDLKLGGSVSHGMDAIDMKQHGSSLVAKEFLNALLEGATLFAMTFDTGESARTVLMELVSEAFNSFLVHSKSILLEESAQLGNEDVGGRDETADEMESGYKEISGALALLVQSVRELASGLALPEVGICPDSAAKLVEQATDLTESMVRRRVDQKFHALRLSIVQDCLIPFTTQAAAEKEAADSDEKDHLTSIIQAASSTLSNCMQLVDDTVRSIFTGNMETGETDLSADVPDLKDAVEASTRKFAFWLASTFELLAGGESCDRNRIADASPDLSEEKDDEPTSSFESMTLNIDHAAEDELSDIGVEAETLLEKLDLAVASLATTEDEDGSSRVHADFVLAIGEMCQMAEGSVSLNLEQSITTHLGGGKKKSRGLFPSGEASPAKAATDERDEISKRFQLAKSRVLVLYASFRGSEAANFLCLNLIELAQTPGTAGLERPTERALKSLEVAKMTSIEFASVFGGNKRAGPVPRLEDDRLRMSTPLMSRKTGLQLDVERIFKEKVSIYPHPSELFEASRDAVVFLLFKIAFRAMIEQARLVQFSPEVYRQLQVDVEFLKPMISHYISRDFSLCGTTASTALSTLLDDFMDVVGDRCLDSGVIEMKDQWENESVGLVKAFLSPDSELCKSFVIDDD